VRDKWLGYNDNMVLDKEIYRKAYESYRQWNEAELIARVRNAGKTPWQKTWSQFVGLWEFGRRMGFQQSEKQSEIKYGALNRYYERVKKMEGWQQNRGRKA